MGPLERWHRRWLIDQLNSSTGDFVLGQVEAADGWSGWAAGDNLRLGASPGRCRRTFDSWYLRWFLREVDAKVARGEWEYREEGSEVVVRSLQDP
ncbi:MAG: hypothetical protein M3P53_04690 [Actinomycetota bacterium]|nr:hypothetical protein [Actinomycetota bacterium]